MPVVLMLGYFLISWSETFPIIAYQSLLNDDLHLSLSAISSYFAITYLPFMWKPLFGWLSDNVPVSGYHRMPHMIVAAIGSAACLLLTSVCVRTAAGLYAASFCNAMFMAFNQLMVGAFLVDLAHCDVGSAAALQGAANAAKQVGSLVAQVMSLGLYGGAGHRSAHSAARPALAASALAPALFAALAPLLPETKDEHAALCRRCDRKEMRFGLVIGVVQANFILIGCQHLMSFTCWWRSVALLAGASVLALLALQPEAATAVAALALRRPSGARRRGGGAGASAPAAAAEEGFEEEGAPARASLLPCGSETKCVSLQGWRWTRLCVFCFLVNAIPSSSVVLGQLQYAVFTPESYQLLNMAGSLSGLAASVAFGQCFKRRGLRRVFVSSALLAALVALSPLPFVASAVAAGPAERSSGAHSIWSGLGAWAVSATLLNGVASMFTILPVDTLVTSASGAAVDRGSTAYAVLLSFHGLGATAGGLLAAPLLDWLGLDGKNWSALPFWVIMTAALKLLIIPLLALIPRGSAGTVGGGEGGSGEEEDEAGNDGEGGGRSRGAWRPPSSPGLGGAAARVVADVPLEPCGGGAARGPPSPHLGEGLLPPAQSTMR